MIYYFKVTASTGHKSMTLDRIPKEFRQRHKLLGRGATSLVFERDADTVYVVSTSSLKRDWLYKIFDNSIVEDTKELGLLKNLRSRLGGDVYSYIMPKLYPLNSVNKKRVKKLLKEFSEVWDRADLKTMMDIHRGIIDRSLEYQRRQSYLTEEAEHIDPMLEELINFVSDYDLHNTMYDPHHKNFMQDKEGNLVLVDPLIEREFMTFFHTGKTK